MSSLNGASRLRRIDSGARLRRVSFGVGRLVDQATVEAIVAYVKSTFERRVRSYRKFAVGPQAVQRPAPALCKAYRTSSTSCFSYLYVISYDTNLGVFATSILCKQRGE